jgi:hypothetical protein
MWRLTVEVISERVIFQKPEEVKDSMVLEFRELGFALDYMRITQRYAIGKISYVLECIEEEKEEGECEC